MVSPSTANGRGSSRCQPLARILVAALALFLAGSAEAAPPKIRTDAANAVPRCVTPKRLMAFIKTRNNSLDPRFVDIASAYKKHGEAWHVRWDYAFFQMLVETNFLTYKRGDGRWGDVDPRQNNFAGLGTTGGGVPGDSYPDVSTGVLAQIQHLVVYSGERIDSPVGARTRLKQDDILATMASKKGKTTFADLARRWAADRHYGASIEWVANNYRQSFCKGPDPVEAAATPPKPMKRTVAAKQEMARAANLGGPVEPEQKPAQIATASTSGPPVRTIWAATSGAADTQGAGPKTAPAVGRIETLTSLPERKPMLRTAAADTKAIDTTIEAEQIIQTGEEPAAPLQASHAPEQASARPADQEATAAPLRREPSATVAAAKQPVARPTAFAYAAALGNVLAKAQPTARANAATDNCRIATASYGGKKILLVRSADSTPVRFTVLTVLEGFEKSMLDSYLKAHAPGGSSVGEFASKDAALAKARELCPRAAGSAPSGEGASAG